MGIFGSLIDAQLDSESWQEFKNQVLMQFGAPMVNVELSDESLLLCLNNAMHYVNLYSPNLVYEPIVLLPGLTDYTLSKYDRIKAVIDIYLHKNFFLMGNYPMDALYFAELNINKGIGGALDFLNDFVNHQTAKSLYGFDMTLKLIPPNTVKVLPQMSMSNQAIIKCTVSHKSDLTTLDEFQKSWIIRYSTALAGRVLARIRSKYDNVGLPIGTLTGDSANILSESLEKETALIKEIKDYGKKNIPEAVVQKRGL